MSLHQLRSSLADIGFLLIDKPPEPVSLLNGQATLEKNENGVIVMMRSRGVYFGCALTYALLAETALDGTTPRVLRECLRMALEAKTSHVGQLSEVAPKKGRAN